jgi:transketolase
MDDLKEIARQLREELITLHKKYQLPHIGSEMSCLEIMVDLYFGAMNKEDTFILSKGHAAYALYAVLHKKGLISDDVYATAGENGSVLAEHTTYPEYLVKLGSLGHGLIIGTGTALARKIDKKPGVTYVLCSDGEMQEGSTLEAMWQAPRFKLGNLVCIIDYNKWQAYDRTIVSDKVLAGMFSAAGWDVRNVEGHVGFAGSLGKILKERGNSEKPLLLIADTVLGKGIEGYEDKLESHYRPPK